MTDEPDITEVLRTCAAQRNHVGYVKVAGDLLENAADEIERLRDEIVRYRVLIAEWADADDAWTEVPIKDNTERHAYANAHDALRKAVGR